MNQNHGHIHDFLGRRQARLSELIASATSTHERTIITKNGRPVAALTSVEDLESLEETLAIMSDPARL